MVSVFDTINVIVRIGDSSVRVVFGIVHTLAVPVLLGASLTDMFVKHSFPPERSIVPYTTQPLLILDIKDLPEEQKNRFEEAQEIMEAKEGHALRLVRMARQT